MLWVTADAVGEAAFARMQREGVIVTVLPGMALPRDIPLTPALRAHALATLAPPGTQVTALCGLWAHGCAPTPHSVDLRCRTRVGLPPRLRGLPAIIHVVQGWQEESVSPVADAAQAAADALRWSPLALAVPAVLCAVDAGMVTVGRLRADGGQGSGEGLKAVEAALLERSALEAQTRLDPVMRRAS